MFAFAPEALKDAKDPGTVGDLVIAKSLLMDVLETIEDGDLKDRIERFLGITV